MDLGEHLFLLLADQEKYQFCNIRVICLYIFYSFSEPILLDFHLFECWEYYTEVVGELVDICEFGEMGRLISW